MRHLALRRLLDFIRHKTGNVAIPQEWMVETTNRCNLACPMCSRDKVEFVERDMDFEFFKQLIEENQDLEAIWPYGFGEPLLHPRIFEMIRYAKSRGITVSLSTNATLLNERLANELIDSGLDFLVLPFDGAKPSTYEKYRYKADFHKVRANIEGFLALKVRRRSSMHVTIQMILLIFAKRFDTNKKTC